MLLFLFLSLIRGRSISFNATGDIRSSLQPSWFHEHVLLDPTDGVILSRPSSNLSSGFMSSKDSDLGSDFSAAITMRVDPGGTVSSQVVAQAALLLSDTFEPMPGNWAGMSHVLEGPAILLNLVDSATGTFNPSISFVDKKRGDQGPAQPSGIGLEWDFTETDSFELLLELVNGSNFKVHVRRNVQEQWREAFNASLGKPIQGPVWLNLGASVQSSLASFSVKELFMESGKDDPREPEVVPSSNENLFERIDSRINDTFVKIDDMSDSLTMQLSRLNSQLKLIMDRMTALEGKSVAEGAPFSKVAALIEQSASDNKKHERDLSRVFSEVRDSKRVLKDFDSSYSNKITMILGSTLCVTVLGLGFVVWNMRRLEKRHIL